MAITLATINARIATIGTGELSVKKELGLVSREMLEYIYENGDIDAVNRLLNVLTPKNKEAGKRFFNAMLPYTFEQIGQKFGAKTKNKDVIAKKLKAKDAFLSNADATIWTWLADQDSSEPVNKPKEYEKKIEALVKKSLDDKEEHIPASAVIRAIIKAGVSLAEIIEAVAPMPKHDGQEEKDNVVPRRVTPAMH